MLQYYCHSRLIIVVFLVFFCIANSAFLGSGTETHLDPGDDFIKSSCEVTRYPELCYETLSAYASSIQDNPLQLANAALNVTLESAESASNNVQTMLNAHNLGPREAGAIRDCAENMKDSVDELQQSEMMMKDLEGPDFDMKMSNIQTWVSAALTDEDTCMDGFEEKAMNGKVKDTVRSYVERVAELTSNALALVNKIA